MTNMTQLIPKKLLIILLIILVIVLGLGIWLGVKILGRQNPEAPSKYSAVYLRTGDIYFGELSWFPWPSLKNVWLVQRTVDSQNQVQLGVVPLKNSFWSPVDKIYLNPREVVFWTKLRKDSQLVRALENPNILNAGAGVQNQQTQQLPQPPQSTNQGSPSANQQNKSNTEQATSSEGKR
jgi:hypothetical protein